MFIKKSDDGERISIFMGTVNPVEETIHELMKPTQDGTKRSVVEAEFLLEHPLDSKFYRYLIGIQ